MIPSRFVWWGTLTGLCLILLAPLTLVDVPPLLDYPNHLARLFVLSAGGGDPVLGRFYQARWGIIPNLALDLIGPALLGVLPVHLAGRLIVGVIFLLPVLGAAAYHRALTGRLSLWPLGSVLFVYNGASLRGFLNFIAAVGLALLFAAIWLRWREERPVRTIAISAMAAVVLFFCHLTGLVFFAILIGGHDIATTRWNFPGLARRCGGFAMVFVLPAILYFASDLHGMEGEVTFRSASAKAQAALFPFINYVWPLDLVTAGTCLTFLGFGPARRWFVIPPQAGLPMLMLLGLFLGLPHGFKGTYDLDTRCIIMVAFLLPAALVPVAPPALTGRIFPLLFAARMAVVMLAWQSWSHDLAAFRAVIAPVKPGDVVLTIRSASTGAIRLSDGTVTDTHLPALLVIEHRAWWPYLFDNLSQQPIETREPFRGLAARIDSASDPMTLLNEISPEARLITHLLVIGPELRSAPRGFIRLTGNDAGALWALPR